MIRKENTRKRERKSRRGCGSSKLEAGKWMALRAMLQHLVFV